MTDQRHGAPEPSARWAAPTLRRRPLPTACALGVATLALSSGCYLSHERAATEDVGPSDATVTLDARRPPIDAAPTCRFEFRTVDGVTGACAIEDATESCAAAAVCLCLARSGSETEALSCAARELVPRSAITFADLCTATPPERMTMSDALEGFLGPDAVLDASPGCTTMPGLIGVRPFAPCGLIAAELCRCVPDCDLDAALGRACLEMSAEQAQCIEREVYRSGVECDFVLELPVLAARCGA